MPKDIGCLRELCMRGRRPDAQSAVLNASPTQLGHTLQVDQACRSEEAQLHRHQELRTAAIGDPVFGKKIEGILGAVRL